MAAVMYRGRSLRSRRNRGRQENGEEHVILDYSKDPAQNIEEVLLNVVKKEGISKARKLGYYNAFVRFCHRFGTSFPSRYTKEEILCCLRVGLLHEAKEMRAVCLRALRYFVQDIESVDAFLRLKIDYLVARSMDLCLDNEIERIHALRLARKVLSIAPEKCPHSLLRVMVSVANNGVHERDKMVKVCLATLCELVMQNPARVCECGGMGSILRNVLDCHHFPRVNESLLAAVLFLVNHPRTRHFIKADIDLEQMLAPFTDSHFRYSANSSEHSSSHERENRFAASKMAIATIIRSWPGMIRLCKPDGSGLQSLIGVLCLPNMETRKEVMDILFDIFRLPVPEWTSDFSQALLSVDPSEMRDSWRLVEGFIAEEGKALLPHLAKTRPNLVDNHMALVLSAFVSAGMLEALIEVITRGDDDKVCVRATILLGELLHMANTIIPYEGSHHSHCLPTLVAMATSLSPDVTANEKQRAAMAVTCLNRLHAMKKRGSVPCSLYLDQIVQKCGNDPEDLYKPLKGHKDKLRHCLEKESEHDLVTQAMRDSQVLHSKENFSWDWDLIGAILKWPDEELKKLDEQPNVKYFTAQVGSYGSGESLYGCTVLYASLIGAAIAGVRSFVFTEYSRPARFVKRLLHFFKPTNKLFSAIELTRDDAKKFSTAGLHFVDFLLESDEDDSQKYIEELLGDVAHCLSEIRAQRAPHDALFTPSFLLHTLCQDYFLFIGRFSTTTKGENFLENTGIYQYLLDIVTVTSHDTYIKLIVSSLDYTRDGLARHILSKALTATSENARLYTAKFMRVLLRAKVPFLSNWGMEMLVMQLYDQSKAVAMEALSVISEACEEEVNLHTLVNMRPSVLHLGYKGAMLLARFLSIPAGFKSFFDAGYVAHELEKWHKTFNLKYVSVVEERLNEALTTYEKTYDGSYTRRSARRQPREDVFVPVHLYGQLVQHKAGYQLLQKQEYLKEYFDCIRHQDLKTDEEILQVKASLWAVGHMGTSVWGLGILQEENIVPEVIKLAEECGVFSVRGTAYNVLGLIASTSKGADMLQGFGWQSVRHKRSDLWPVIDEEKEEEVMEGGLPNCPSTPSLISSAKSDGAGKTVPAVLYPRDTGQAPSPPSSTSSPKGATFYIDSGNHSKSRSSTMDSDVDLMGPKSRSDTGSTGPLHSSSQEASPNTSTENVHSHTSRVAPAQVLVHVTEATPETYNSIHALGTCIQESKETRSASAPGFAPDISVVHQRSQSDPHDSKYGAQSSVHFSDNIVISDHERTSSLKVVSGIRTLRGPTLGTGSDSDTLSSLQNPSRHAAFQDERSSSNESSRTSKSRSDSLNTDTTTSGISSYESGQPGCAEPTPLSPIPSASSMNTNNSRPTSFQDDEKQSVHPSDTLRRLANLKRVPSLKRRYSNPNIRALSPFKSLDTQQHLSESMIVYTSSRDAHGYATLRELQKQRTISIDGEGDLNINSIFEEPHVTKTRSLDFRLGKPSGSARNMSFASLMDLDMPMLPTNPYDSIQRSISKDKDRLKKTSHAAGRAEYIGICLPVDIGMIFQVNEGEDQRSSLSEAESHQLQPSVPIQRSVSDTVTEQDAGLEYHTPAICLACYRIKRDNNVLIQVGQEDDDAFVGTEGGACDLHYSSSDQTQSANLGPSPTSNTIVTTVAGGRGIKSRNSSLSDMVTIPGSITSMTSVESSAKPNMCEDNDMGKMMIRKEVLRLIVNLSSSVGIKGTEQSLLVLKQKFFKSFHDLCLYSEVCYLLAHYNYRLNSRRFIQELFQDVSSEKLLDDPAEILGLDEASLKSSPTDTDVKLEKVLESTA